MTRGQNIALRVAAGLVGAGFIWGVYARIDLGQFLMLVLALLGGFVLLGYALTGKFPRF